MFALESICMRRVRHRRRSFRGRDRGDPKAKRRSRWTKPKKPKQPFLEYPPMDGAIQGISSPKPLNFKLIDKTA